MTGEERCPACGAQVVEKGRRTWFAITRARRSGRFPCVACGTWICFSEGTAPVAPWTLARTHPLWAGLLFPIGALAMGCVVLIVFGSVLHRIGKDYRLAFLLMVWVASLGWGALTTARRYRSATLVAAAWQVGSPTWDGIRSLRAGWRDQAQRNRTVGTLIFIVAFSAFMIAISHPSRHAGRGAHHLHHGVHVPVILLEATPSTGRNP